MTEHHYDRAGRLVRSVTRRESEWDQAERAWLIALAVYRSEVHEQCGTYLPDAIRAEDDGAFKAELPVRCHVCTARLAAQAGYLQGGGHSPHPEALLWPVVRRKG